MAIKQIVPIFIQLTGDGSSTTYVFALANVYQQGFGGSVPFGTAGVVPSTVAVVNPPVPVTSSTIDANGNITITFTSALPASQFSFEVDLTYNSGSSSSASPTQTSNVTLAGSSAVQLLDSGGSNKASISAAGAVKVDGSAVTQPVSGTITANAGTGSFTVAQATAANLNATVTGTVAATQSGTWTVQPGNTANTTAWLVTGTGGTFPVTQATAANLNATVVGGLTHNNAAPAANNVGALVGVASSAAPTYTAGDQVLLSTDLAGNLRTISTTALTDLVGTAGTLNAANQTATINAAGYSHVGMFLAAGTLVGTIVPECSLDGGTTWVSTFFNDPTTNATQASIVFGSANTATSKSLVGVAGASNYRVRVSAFTSGTASCTLRANEIGDPSSLQGGLVASTIQPPCTVQDGAWVTTAAPTYSTTTLNPLSLTTAGGVRSDMSSVNATALGTPTAFGTTPGAVNALQVNSSVFIGTTVAVAAAAGIQKVGISGNAGATFDAVITAGTAAANMVQVGGVFNSTVPALTTGQAVVLQVDPTGSQFITAEGRKTTYRAATAATATAGTGVVLQITGSATKTVKITRIHVTAFAATAAQTTFKLQRTSVAATAGTSAALTAGKLDNNDAAATAVVTHWTATGGTTGTTVGGALISDSVWMQPSTFAAPTSTGHDREWNAGQFPGGKEITLRGTADLMTLTSSGTLAASQVWVEWTEE